MENDAFQVLKLSELKVGESAVIQNVGGQGELRQHFLDMGIIPGAEVTLVKFAPMGDPMELQVHGYELTLRLAEADKIQIQKIIETYGSYKNKKNIQLDTADLFYYQYCCPRDVLCRWCR